MPSGDDERGGYPDPVTGSTEPDESSAEQSTDNDPDASDKPEKKGGALREFAILVSIAVFATLSTLEMKQLGVGLAVAILLDATLIRGVLLPAALTLLGSRAWKEPRSMRKVPAVSHD